MVDLLPRIDTRYLNCWKSLVISYLKSQGVPVELLFFNSFESTSEIYRQIILNRMPRWDYASVSCSDKDLELLNIKLTHQLFGSYQEAKHKIINRLSLGKPTFITCDMFHLPHKTNHYHQDHVRHLILAVGCLPTGSGYVYQILDDNASAIGDYCLYEYDEKVLELAFNHSERLISQVKQENFGKNVVNQFEQKFIEWIILYEDDYYLYDLAASRIANYSLDFHDNIFEQLISAFTIVSGSRAMFLKFLRHISQLPTIQALLAECSLQSELLANALLKSRITNRVDMKRLQEKCSLVKSLDIEVIQGIMKSSYFLAKKGSLDDAIT